MNGHLFTGSDDGCIKVCIGTIFRKIKSILPTHKQVWSPDLKLTNTWQAHQYVVYDLACDSDSNKLYSCSMDGEIKLWDVACDPLPVCIATAVQTVSGEGETVL